MKKVDKILRRSLREITFTFILSHILRVVGNLVERVQVQPFQIFRLLNILPRR